MVVIFDDRTTLGMVRLYAEELTEKLGAELMKSIEKNQGREPGVSNDYKDAAAKALDDFFGPNLGSYSYRELLNGMRKLSPAGFCALAKRAFRGRMRTFRGFIKPRQVVVLRDLPGDSVYPPAGGRGDAMGFGGSIESFSLADVFQNLAMNQQKGTLRVQAPDGTERNVYFDGGQIRNISHGFNKPLIDTKVLVGRGLVAENQAAEGMARVAGGEPLLTALMSLNYLAKEKADELVSHQIEEEIYELFAWEKGNFEFNPGAPPDGLFVEQGVGSPKGLPISHLIMEAARRVDDWDRLKRQIPSFAKTTMWISMSATPCRAASSRWSRSRSVCGAREWPA